MKSEIVPGVINRVEHYGLYVTTPRGLALVLIPDVASEPISDLRVAFSVGQSVRVQLLKFVEDRGMYKGSMIDIGQE